VSGMEKATESTRAGIATHGTLVPVCGGGRARCPLVMRLSVNLLDVYTKRLLALQFRKRPHDH